MLSVRRSRAGRLAGKLNLMLLIDVLLYPTTACTDKPTYCVELLTTTATTAATTAATTTAAGAAAGAGGAGAGATTTALLTVVD
jgi:hypothetical protein